MSRPYPPVHYNDYLKIDELLLLQQPQSRHYGVQAHDETLFIITHQVYELWFKQILTELDSIIEVFASERIDEVVMLTMNSRLQRIIEIQKLLVDQVSVLETMTPLDFLEFRDFLYPASGFQSAQFRLIENKLGLQDRLTYNNADYKTSLASADRVKAEQTEAQPSLFTLLERWLERTPFIANDTYNFWQKYREAVERRNHESRQFIMDSTFAEEAKTAHLKNLQQTERSFKAIFDEVEYNNLQTEGHWRLSHRALRAALFIHLYRHEPLLQLPFQLINHLQTIDENFTQWRHRHALMAHRMLGAKMGTGGSSGHKYLKAASEQHKIFQDFFNLATFFIPKSHLPELPIEIQQQVRFRYQSS